MGGWEKEYMEECCICYAYRLTHSKEGGKEEEEEEEEMERGGKEGTSLSIYLSIYPFTNPPSLFLPFFLNSPTHPITLTRDPYLSMREHPLPPPLPPVLPAPVAAHPPQHQSPR